MGRPKSKSPTIQTAVRLEPSVVSAIDAEIGQIEKTTGVKVTRSAVIRAWLFEAAVTRVGRK